MLLQNEQVTADLFNLQHHGPDSETRKTVLQALRARMKELMAENWQGRLRTRHQGTFVDSISDIFLS